MPPEQFRGAEVDAQSDQFSFCAALYEALFRQPPFPGASRDVISALVIAGKVRPPPPNELGLDVTQALMRGLSVEPSRRFPSMRELIDELRKGMGPHVDTRGSRRARRIFAAVFAVVAGLCSIPPLIDNRPPPISVLFTVAVVCLLVALLITALSYKRLRQHPEHWSLVLLVNLAMTQLTLGRAGALWMGVTLFQYTPIDHVVVLGFVAAAAYRWIPKMWLALPPVILSGMLCAIAPAKFWQLPAVLYPLIGCLYALWWPQRIRTPSKSGPA